MDEAAGGRGAAVLGSKVEVDAYYLLKNLYTQARQDIRTGFDCNEVCFL